MESGRYVNDAALSTKAGGDRGRPHSALADPRAIGLGPYEPVLNQRLNESGGFDSSTKLALTSALPERLTGAVTLAVAFERVLRRLGELESDAIVRFRLKLRPLEERPRDLRDDVERVVGVGQRDLDLLAGAEHRQRHHLSTEHGDVDQVRAAAFHGDVQRIPDREPRHPAGADDL